MGQKAERRVFTLCNLSPGSVEHHFYVSRGDRAAQIGDEYANPDGKDQCWQEREPPLALTNQDRRAGAKDQHDDQGGQAQIKQSRYPRRTMG